MIADVRERLDRVPFVPFSIRTSDGHEYSVPTADYADISPRRNRLVVFTDEGAAAILGTIHINSVIEQPNGA
jgi:hypothetical protein